MSAVPSRIAEARQIESNGEGGNFRRDGTLTDPRSYGVEMTYRFGAFK
jgi:hypothetical protein